MTITPGTLLLVIGAMVLATYPVRVMPLLFFNHRSPPKWLQRWLRHVPLAVFAAILTQTLVPKGGTCPWQTLLGAGVALILGAWTRSMGISTVIGFLVYAAAVWWG